MQPDDEVRSRFAAWRKSLPSAPFLMGGLLIALIVVAVELSGGPEGARAICDQIVDDLGRLQPFALIGTYFAGMPCSGWNTGLECGLIGAVSVFDPAKGIGRLFVTIAQAWSQSGVPGRVVFPLALLAALPLAYLGVIWLFGRLFRHRGFNIFALGLALVATPFVASVLALGLQFLGIALFGVLGAMFGLIAWTLSVFAGLFGAWRVWREALEWGHRLQHAAEAVVAKPE